MSLGLGEPFDAIWEALRPAVNAALNDGHYLQDTPEVRAKLAEADGLARKLD
jgi:hypothetical protein